MNVLFLMADELAWWGLNCYRQGLVKTPNLDALTERGMVFDAAYTPSPICVPTRAAIATGKYLHEIGYWSSAQAYDGAVPSWGHWLQEAEIPVTSIGKLHYRSQADATGFDEQIEPIHIPGGTGWLMALLRRPLPDYMATAELAEMIGEGPSSYTDYDLRVTAEATQWLHNPERREKPWAAFVSWVSPHYPLQAPSEYYNLYNPEELQSGPEPTPDHPILQEIVNFFDHDPFFTEESRGIARAAYFGLCSFLDAQVGQVLDALNASGQADETLIIFTSDHGEMLGEKGFWTKSTMYESSARIPLIVAGPGAAIGRCETPVSLIDCAPTIAAAFGVSTNGFSGQSLLADLPPDRCVFSEYHDGGASVGITMVRWNDGDQKWKYIHYAESYPPQLFELSSDPDETNDLSQLHPEILEHARNRMAAQLDPEAINVKAHADQAVLVEKYGGRDEILKVPQWNYTPTDSR